MKIFNLPDLGEGLPDAEIHEWHVKVGDTVAVDQPICSMETAKAVVEVPSPQDGTIEKLFGTPGDIIETGSPLIGFIAQDTTSASLAQTHANTQQSGATVAGNIEVGHTVLQESAMGVSPSTPGRCQGIQAMPAIRYLAAQLNIDLTKITPSGQLGHISLDDFANAIKLQLKTTRTIPQSLSGELSPLRGVRRTMAQMMSDSHRQVVPVTLVDDADIHAWPKDADISARIIRAIVSACEQESALNVLYDGATMTIAKQQQINLGLAVDAPDGLFVPVIHDVANLSAKQLRDKINTFKAQIAARNIPQDDLQGATITLSNFGTFAGRYANPIIVPPTVAIIGTGRFRDQAVLDHHGHAKAHRIMPISVTFDHRACTGGEASRFLAAMIADLQQAL